jgi:hypothetical protein
MKKYTEEEIDESEGLGRHKSTIQLARQTRKRNVGHRAINNGSAANSYDDNKVPQT